jgi:protein-S-isoprenylcysteine O-methyltransferase Ste14
MDLAKAVRDPWVWAQLGLVLIIALIAPLAPRYINLGSADFILNRVDPVWVRSIGAVLIISGTRMMVSGVRSLGRSLTPGTEPLAEAELVTSRAYAGRRHPIYAGAVLLLTGYTLAWSNWTLALILGGVTLLFFEAKARREEQWLQARFPEYERYRRRVPRRLF